MTTKSITADSGSSRKPTSIVERAGGPASSSVLLERLGALPANCQRQPRATRSAAPREAHADRGHQRPSAASAPKQAVQRRAGERQERNQPEQFEHAGLTSPAQEVDAVDVDRVPLAEDGDEQGEADRGLGRGDRHDEEDDDLAGVRLELPRVGDQGEVRRRSASARSTGRC